MKKKILFITLPFAIFFLVIEFGFGSYFYFSLKSFFSPPKVSEILFKNKSHLPNSKCPYHDLLGPAPYVGYIYKPSKAEACGTAVNNVGRSGPDFPLVKDATEFVVLITGGSVAELAALEGIQGSTTYFERHLNERFHPPRGERFKVISAAMGDYRTPQNIISLMLFHDIVDAVIDISGFNEALLYFQNAKFSKGAESYWKLFELERLQVASEESGKVFNLSLAITDSICSFSYTCLFIAKKIVDLLIIDGTKSEGRSEELKEFDYYSSQMENINFDELRLQQHVSYYEIFHALCESRQKICSFFLQPIPQLSKDLTAEERALLLSTREDFAELYSRIVRRLTALRSEKGVPIHSLVSIFQDVKQRIYMDHIHYGNFNHGEISLGNQLLWNNISNSIATEWRLTRKNGN